MYFVSDSKQIKNTHNQQEIANLVSERLAKLLISLINGIIEMFPVVLVDFQGLFLYAVE